MSLHTLMHNPVSTWLRKPSHVDCALFILRLAVGAVFMYHGWQKLQGLDAIVGFFGKIGIPAAGVMAPFIAGLEFFGGALIILGLAVRPIAFLLACTMLVAIFQAKGLSSWAKIEIDVAMLAMNLALLLTGAGACSIDAKIARKAGVDHASSLPVAAPKA